MRAQLWSSRESSRCAGNGRIRQLRRCVRGGEALAARMGCASAGAIKNSRRRRRAVASTWVRRRRISRGSGSVRGTSNARDGQHVPRLLPRSRRSAGTVRPTIAAHPEQITSASLLALWANCESVQFAKKEADVVWSWKRRRSGHALERRRRRSGRRNGRTDPRFRKE